MKPTIIYYTELKPDLNSRETALFCVRQYASQFGIPLGGLALSVSPSGKPYLPDCPIHFSISHSGLWWACAVSTQETGLDIQEEKQVKTDHIARRFFTEAEQDYCSAIGSHGFFQIWAAKEGYTKWLGLGLSHPLSSFSTAEKGSLKNQLPNCWLHHFEFKKGYVGCICTSKKTEYYLYQLETNNHHTH